MSQVFPVIDSNLQLFQLLENRLDEGGLVEARRLFHGRGLCYPVFEFLTVDWFAPAMLFSFYKQPDESVLELLIEDVEKWFEGGVTGVSTVVLQFRWAQPVETIVLGEDLVSPHHVQENGLTYEVNLTANQNVGLFLDAREVRHWVRKNAEEKNVLNLFAYTCSFSVAAIAGGANAVVNIDMSRGALAIGKINHDLNVQQNNKENNDTSNKTQVSSCHGRNSQQSRSRKRASFLSHNIFKSWGKLRKLGPYSLIIVDPPSYQPGSFVASKDYAKIVTRLSDLLQPGGLVVSVLNSPQVGFEFLRDMFRSYAPDLEEVEVLTTPRNFEELEDSRGLKVIVFRRQS